MADSNVDISQVTIEVAAEAGGASREIDSLAATLSRLNASSKLTRTIKNLDKLSSALHKFEGLNGVTRALDSVATSLERLTSIQKLSGLNSALNTLKKLPEITRGLDASRLNALSNAVAPISSAIGELGSIQKLSGLNSVLNTLKKIPEVTKGLKEADLGAFATQLRKVRDAVAPLAAEMDKVSRGFSTLPANIQRAIKANQKLTESNHRAEKSFNLLGLRIPKAQLGFAGFALAIRKVSQYLGQSLADFNAYVENANLFNVSMGEYAEEAAEFAKKMQDVLGVDMSDALRNMGILQNLTTSFGVASDKAYILSKNLTQLGYDISSLFNLDYESSFTKIQAAISGELEPIRRLGVDISEARLSSELLQLGDVSVDLSEATLQQELYARGVNMSVKSLNQADKALLRYIAIIKQTSNAQTDMGRTLNSPANMMRIFGSQIGLLSRAIGSLLIPMLNAVLPPLIAVIKIVREVIEAIAALIGVTVEFGNEEKHSKPNLGGFSSGLDNIAGSAAGAAKELAYLIGGFDELNVLPSPGGGAGGAGGGYFGSVLGDLDLPEYDMFENLAKSKVTEWVEKLRTPLKAILITVGLIGAGFLAWKVGNAIIDGLTVVRGLVKWIVGKDGGLLMIQSISPQLAKALSAIGPTLFLAAGAVALMALRFLDLLTSSEKFRAGLNNIWEMVKTIGVSLWEGLVQGLEPAGKAISNLGKQILNLLPEEWQKRIMAFFSETLPQLIDSLGLDFGDLGIVLVGIGLMFLPGGKLVGAALLGFEAITLGIRGLGLLTDEQMESIKGAFKMTFEAIGNFVGSVISGVVTYITSLFSGVISFLSGVFTLNWGKVFEGLKSGALAPFKAVAAFIDQLFGVDIFESIKNALNRVIGLVNRMIGWLNDKLHISFDGFSIRGKQIIPGFDTQLVRIPSIPQLADGGVLTNPQLVMAGEYAGAATNPEIVTPQNIMRETVAEANAEMVVAIVNAIRSLQQTVENKDQSVYISEGDIGRAAAAYAQQQHRRTGRNPLATV